MKLLFSILALWTVLTHNNHHRILQANARDVAGVISTELSLTLFNRALVSTGLDFFFSAGGPYTVFSPNDEAFGQLNEKYFQPEWAAHMTEILFQHIVEGPAVATDFMEVGLQLDPYSGPIKITITQTDPTIQINENITIVTPNLSADNGIVHIIDGVILPPSAQDSIMDIITKIQGVFSILQELLVMTGLDVILQGEGPYTMFAPDNDAFEKLGQEELDRLRANPDALKALLEHHIVPGIYLTFNLEDAGSEPLPTLEGTGLEPPDELKFPDLLSTNGVLHVVSDVLMLPTGGTDTPSPVAGGPTLIPSMVDVEEPNENLDGTITDIIVASNYTLMTLALNMTGWLNSLQGQGNYTVFAVPDDGFGMVPMKFLEDPVWNSHLTNIVTYHIITQVIWAVDLTKNRTIDTVNEVLDVTVTNDDPLQINGINVTITDIRAENGVVHVLEKVLLPPSATDNALALITSFPQFTILNRLLNVTGLYDLFNSTGPLTVIAPLDSAFQALGGGLAELEEDPDALKNILLYHLVPKLVEFLYIPSEFGSEVTTEQGSNVTFSFDGGVRTINDIPVPYPDLLVQNGIMQVIDSVLIPPEGTVPPTGMANSTTAPTEATTESMTQGSTTGMTGVMTQAPTEVDVTTVPPTGMVTSTTLPPTQATNESMTQGSTSNMTDVMTQAPTEVEVATSAPEGTAAPTGRVTLTTLPPTQATTQSMTQGSTSSMTGAMTQAPTEGEEEVTTTAPTGEEELETATQVPTESEVITPAPTVAPEPIPTAIPSASPTGQPPIVSPMPTGEPNLLAIIQSNPLLSTFALVIESSGLSPLFEDEGPFTIFAPNDEAFEKLEEPLDQDNLANIVLYHMLTERILEADLVEGQTYATAEGSLISIDRPGNGNLVQINGYATVDANQGGFDLPASNGVLHIIDSVLFIPETLPTVAPNPAVTNPPTRMPTPPPTPGETSSPTIPTTPTTADDCVAIPGQQVCCPPGITTGVYFFCRYI